MATMKQPNRRTKGYPKGVTRRALLKSLRTVRLGRAMPDHWSQLQELLARSGLDSGGLKPWLMNTFIALVADKVVGVAAYEMYEDAGLLRSVAVDYGLRGRRLGTRLVSCVERAARERGMKSLFLLTETADDFFAKLGYVKTTREALPAAASGSEILRRICPASARVMFKDLV